MHTPKEIASVGEAVLKHAVTSTGQRLVCTMAMVCKDWRAAVKDKAPAGLLHVSFKVRNRWAPDDAGMPSEGMLKLASFSQWLPQHAKLVRKLEVSQAGYWRRNEDDKNRTWFNALAEPVFSLALRTAAAACIKTSVQQQLQPLGLQSYSSDVLDTSAVLQSLPVASLTELAIPGCDRSALVAALPRLTNLQRLEMYHYDYATKPMAAVFQAAQQLSALTELSCPRIYSSSSDVKLVPPHLLRLQLRVPSSGVADFSHITRLTSLKTESGLSAGYRFPAQLVELSIADRQLDDGSSAVNISNISSLACLESLKIRDSHQNAEDLLQLVALPKLQKLYLHHRYLYYETQTVFAASAVWPKLPQLQSVYLDELRCSSSACMQLFRNLGKVAWLTQLCAHIELRENTEQQSVPIAICSEISKLKMLRGLDITMHGANSRSQQSSWAQDDLARLSDLTQLTKLDLYVHNFDHRIIDDATVTLFLFKMKQLQELSVPVTSVAVLHDVAVLCNLTKLRFYNLPGAVQRLGLRCLQGMKSLTVLEGFNECSKQELADFWAAVRA